MTTDNRAPARCSFCGASDHERAVMLRRKSESAVVVVCDRCASAVAFLASVKRCRDPDVRAIGLAVANANFRLIGLEVDLAIARAVHLERSVMSG